LEGLFRTKDVESAFNTLRSWNPSATYLYTKGGAGASLHIGDAAWSLPAPKIEVVDTVGAGDASIAALAWSMMHREHQQPLQHLRFCVAAGAAACLAPGASPPALADIERLL